MASNEVYFCTDKAAVEDGTTLVATVNEGNFQPGTLEYGQIYCWKANEVNDAAAVLVREGDVWEFSTVENLLVDDFEGYTDDDPAATQTASFTARPVYMACFADQGVNIASVKKIILGVGNASAPVAGGSGTMYFDDIAVGNPVAQCRLTR